MPRPGGWTSPIQPSRAGRRTDERFRRCLGIGKDSGTLPSAAGVYDLRPTEAVAQYSILAGIVVRQPPQLAVRKVDDPAPTEPEVVGPFSLSDSVRTEARG